MKPRQHGILRLTVPIRALLQRFTFLLLIVVSIGLLVLSKADLTFGERVRAFAADAISPILVVLSQPIEATQSAWEATRNLVRMQEENARLRQENARLLKWQDVARRLEQDNARFRKLLSVAAEPAISFVSARIIGDSGGSYVRTMLTNVGMRDGIGKGQAVLTEDGVVGRIIEVGLRSSRILLLSDLNSRLPVMLEGSRHRAILSGDNSDQPRLEFLPSAAQVSPGDRVLTSGHGGLFPPGLPVGVVTSTTDGIVRVQPFVDTDKLELISIVYYDLPRPVAEGEATGARLSGR